jgi:hypothetical protein
MSLIGGTRIVSTSPDIRIFFLQVASVVRCWCDHGGLPLALNFCGPGVVVKRLTWTRVDSQAGGGICTCAMETAGMATRRERKT